MKKKSEREWWDEEIGELIQEKRGAYECILLKGSENPKADIRLCQGKQEDGRREMNSVRREKVKKFEYMKD